MCCSKNLPSKNGVNGAATLAPSGNPPVPPVYASASGTGCGSYGAVVGNAPYLTSPDDYASLPPIVSVPVIDRRGRQAPNNAYVFSSPPPGVIQVQSPKVGRY